MAQQSYKYIYFYTTFRCYKILVLMTSCNVTELAPEYVHAEDNL